MKLKMNEQGFAVVKGGKPIYVHADGREEAIDAAGAMAALHRSLFESSKFVAEKLSIPADVAMASFGGSFKVENGKVVAYDGGEIPIYSRTRHGEPANFEEAIEYLVDRYPQKEMIVRKNSGKAVVPAAPNVKAPTNAGGKSVVTRAQFDGMTQRARAEHCLAGGSVVD